MSTMRRFCISFYDEVTNNLKNLNGIYFNSEDADLNYDNEVSKELYN